MWVTIELVSVQWIALNNTYLFLSESLPYPLPFSSVVVLVVAG